jgi:iron complex outermembrane receptor protein
MRFLCLASAIALSTVALTLAKPAAAGIRKPVSVHPQELTAALQMLAHESGLHLVYIEEDVNSRQSPGASGDLTPEEALKRVLKGTGLTYKFLDGETVTIMPVSQGARFGRQDLSAASPRQSSLEVTENDARSSQDLTALREEHLRLAQVSSDPTQGLGTSPSSSPPSPSDSSWLTEIVVTAQKKTERLQDVPMSITVLDPQALAENGQNSILDYFASVPGLNVAGNANYSGANYITIRGLSAGSYQNPIVSTVVDDVPTTSSVQRGLGAFTSPDLDPSDLARIEILKGPQGTLYGADSLGGLIKYVTADPSTDALSGRGQMTGVDIPGGGLGYAVRGEVNVPLSDDMALRVSAFSRHDPGYIDDLTTGKKGFNSTNVDGGHLAALWRPSDNLSIRLSAFIQDTRGYGSQYDSTATGQSDYGDLGVHTLPGTAAYMTQDQLYSATVNWKVAGLEIVSVTGYIVNTLKTWADDTTAFGQTAYGCEQNPNPASTYYCSVPPGSPSVTDGVPLFVGETTKKPSQELRIGSAIGRWLDWRIGGFYTHEDGAPANSTFYAANPITGSIQSPFYVVNDTTQTFREYAVFGDITAHVTDKFDIQFGGRGSWNKQADQLRFSGIATQAFLLSPSPTSGPLFQNDGNAFTYEVAPRFKITPDLMAYARIATGYRIGGYNSTYGIPAAAAFQIPPGFSPDKTTNYELGIKGDLLDRRISFDAAIYYINWKNFQTDVTNTILVNGSYIPYGYTANAGFAKSEGAEFSIEAHPLEGLTITAQGSYDDAALTRSLPLSGGLYGVEGTQLPYSMRFSGGLTAIQNVHLTKDWVGFLGGAVNYVGSRPYEFVGLPPTPRTIFPAYTTCNFSVGAEYQLLRINMYINNLNNSRGILGFNYASSLGNPQEYVATAIQPRTVGLSIIRSF